MSHKGFWDVVRDIRVAAPKCCIDFINNGSLMIENNINKCIAESQYIEPEPQPEQEPAPLFDIITTVYRNQEWIAPFLYSLHKTLKNRSRKIYILDSSPLEEFEKTRRMDTFGLDVSFIHLENHSYACLLQGIQMMNPSPHLYYEGRQYGDAVCLCNVDIVFLLKDWDYFVEQQMRNGPYHMVAVAPRYITHAETTFIVASKQIILKSQLHPTPPKGVELKSKVQQQEDAYLTYLHCLEQRPFLLLTKHIKAQGRWGHIILNDQNQEFFYHNFYSARCKKEGNDIPESEYHEAKELIDCCFENAGILMDYLMNGHSCLQEYLATFQSNVPRDKRIM